MLQVEHDVELDVDLSQTEYFTDSKDGTAWLKNEHESLPKYVTSPPSFILQISKISQSSWLHGLKNPADVGTRPFNVPDLMRSRWLYGPDPEDEVQDLIDEVTSLPILSITISRHDISSGEHWKSVVTEYGAELSPADQES